MIDEHDNPLVLICTGRNRYGHEAMYDYVQLNDYEQACERMATSTLNDPAAVAVAVLLRMRGYSLDNFLAFDDAIGFAMVALQCDLHEARARLFNVRKVGGFAYLPHAEWKKPRQPDAALLAAIEQLRNEHKIARDSNEVLDVIAERLHEQFPMESLAYLHWAWIRVAKNDFRRPRVHLD